MEETDTERTDRTTQQTPLRGLKTSIVWQTLKASVPANFVSSYANVLVHKKAFHSQNGTEI